MTTPPRTTIASEAISAASRGARMRNTENPSPLTLFPVSPTASQRGRLRFQDTKLKQGPPPSPHSHPLAPAGQFSTTIFFLRC